MNHINSEIAKIWNERLAELMKREGYTQEAFVKAFKKKYNRGTQTNISRWCRVGTRIVNKNGENKEIGFPSYETMKQIADFFGVSIGYLIGETDFQSFEMERTCKFLGIDESTGKAIQSIAIGDSVEHFGKHFIKQNSATFKYLVTAKFFEQFIKGIRELADNLYNQHHPVNHLDSAVRKINPDVVDIAFQCLEYTCGYDDEYGEINEFKENNIELTQELKAAIRVLEDAMEKDAFQSDKLERKVKLSKYELLEIYFKMIEEITVDTHLDDMIVPIMTDGEIEIIKSYGKNGGNR